MVTAICITLVLLLVSAIIFYFATIVILGKILIYGAVALGVVYLIKWIFD